METNRKPKMEKNSKIENGKEIENVENMTPSPYSKYCSSAHAV
jgi:hypothetical protein